MTCGQKCFPNSFCLLLVLNVLLSNTVAANHCTNMKDGGSNSFISVIIISDKDAVPRFQPRYKNYVANFTNSMVANMKTKSVSFQEMYIKEDNKCPKRSPVKDELSDNYTVPNIAHIEAWKQFYSSQKDCPRNTLLVFSTMLALVFLMLARLFRSTYLL